MLEASQLLGVSLLLGASLPLEFFRLVQGPYWSPISWGVCLMRPLLGPFFLQLVSRPSWNLSYKFTNSEVSLSRSWAGVWMHKP